MSTSRVYLNKLAGVTRTKFRSDFHQSPSAHGCWYFEIQQNPRLTLFVLVEIHKCSRATGRQQYLRCWLINSYGPHSRFRWPGKLCNLHSPITKPSSVTIFFDGETLLKAETTASTAVAEKNEDKLGGDETWQRRKKEEAFSLKKN
ncbi:flagellar basal-body rod protein FlgF [Striga asiatica]|uniref:Flagellar basal-body rod protein FlgF n=1 Tax=Striga asiatica TaxID=4170 RepID=A0A5A7P1Y8_STRAF|nr:flagellar basal-body rod protein FlgF [Striga asiatica]